VAAVGGDDGLASDSLRSETSTPPGRRPAFLAMAEYLDPDALARYASTISAYQDGSGSRRNHGTTRSATRNTSLGKPRMVDDARTQMGGPSTPSPAARLNVTVQDLGARPGVPNPRSARCLVPGRRGNITHAAERLGTSRRALRLRIERWRQDNPHILPPRLQKQPKQPEHARKQKGESKPRCSEGEGP
jgi:hypothetical protein